MCVENKVWKEWKNHTSLILVVRYSRIYITLNNSNTLNNIIYIYSRSLKYCFCPDGARWFVEPKIFWLKALDSTTCAIGFIFHSLHYGNRYLLSKNLLLMNCMKVSSCIWSGLGFLALNVSSSSGL